MKLIICVDDNFGMMFNKRRQSQDRLLREKIVMLCKDSVLWMNDYTSSQFQNGIEQIVKLKQQYHCDIRVDNDMLIYAIQHDYCFIENKTITHDMMQSVHEIILVKWNRDYPSDMFFNKEYLNDFMLKDTMNFEGYSHDEITIERYKRK